MSWKSRIWALALVTAMVVAACGGESSGNGDDQASDETDAPVETTQGSTTETPTDSPSTTQSSGEDGPQLTGNGTATLTFGDITVDFTGVTCFYDEAAAETYNDEDATFLAIARDGDAAFWVLIRDKGLELFTVAYLTGGSDQWHMGYDAVNNDINPVYSVENGVITVEGGEFELIKDRQETDTVEPLSVQANCG